jgi:Do/DeqQ family serine protease
VPARATAIARRLAALLLPALLLAALPAAGQAVPGRDPIPSLAPTIERVAAGVVNISVRQTVTASPFPQFRDPFFQHFFGQLGPRVEREVTSAGSGVVVDAERGLIVTNDHVVDRAEQVVVTFTDRRRRPAKLIGRDPETDLALLRVQAEDLTDVPYGDSDALRVGDFVIAIGNPFGIGQSATIGMVSALQRSGLGVGAYEAFIQTDASINPGNSGGALVDQQGRLVGINTAILSRSGGNHGIGFAIPARTVAWVVGQLAQHGRVARGAIGLSAQDLTPDVAERLGIEADGGAVVVQLARGGAAQRAGLRPGDAIVALDGAPVRDAADLRYRLAHRSPGARLELDVIRRGQARSVTVTLDRRAPGREPA